MALVFYEVEEKVHKKSYGIKLNKVKSIKIHKKLCKEYNINNTKLGFDNRTLGYYDTECDIIVVPEDVTLGVLLHEVGHALEHKRFGETNHRDRLFQVINELNIFAENNLI